MPAGSAAALPRRVQTMIVLAIGAPFAVAVVATLLRAWPATIAIDWLAGDDGRYGVKAAIMGSWLLVLLAELALLLPIALAVAGIRRWRARPDGAGGSPR